MKKTLTKLIVGIESKTKTSKRSSKTINTYINKVPVNQEQLIKPSSAAQYVDQEMREYPIPVKARTSKRQQMLNEKIKIQLNKNRRVFTQLISKLEQKLSFFDLQQMRELIQKMGDKQIHENKIAFKKLKSLVNYYLESSTQSINNEEHIIQSAEALLQEIRQAQNKKVNQIY